MGGGKKMTSRIISTLRAWAHYINHCSRAAYVALLLLILLTVISGARFFYNAGAAHALESCKVYAESRVTLVYNGRVINR